MVSFLDDLLTNQKHILYHCTVVLELTRGNNFYCILFMLNKKLKKLRILFLNSDLLQYDTD